ncbi:MAG TPA: radical SAM protein [Bacteroidales bacterium]|nr:radical SAM protein [Bacteroidales bacterium]
MKENPRYDLVLIVPPYIPKQGFIWKAIEYHFQSPGVLAIASYLNSKGFKTAIFDCNLEQIEEKKFETEFLQRFVNYEINYIGFSAATQTVNLAYRLAKLAKRHKPNSKIIFGGAHATALPEDVLKNYFVDIVVIGEGELSIEQILLQKNIEEINGIAYKKDNKIIINPAQERINNLDELPINDYNLIPIHLCKPLIGTYEKLPATIMVTARGCPFKCTFCSRVAGDYLSVMSPQRMLDEIIILYNDFGIRQIIFYDDTFISNKKRVEEFCDLLIDSGIKIKWTCSSRVDKIYPDLLIKMKKAGCHQIMYGIESFDEQILANINKKTNPKDIETAIKETKKAGIEARAAIMIGNPGDTVEILEANIKKLKKLNPDIIQVTIATAIPGSQLFAEAHANNEILTYDWNKYEGNIQITKHENLDFKTLQKYYRKTYLKFYLRPRYIFSTLLKTNSMLKIKLLFIGLISIFPILFSAIFNKNK